MSTLARITLTCIWAREETTNIAFDLSFLQSRIIFLFFYFLASNDDVPQPEGCGISSGEGHQGRSIDGS